MVKINSIFFNPFFGERCSILSDETAECVIVDPGCMDTEELGTLYDFIEKNKLKPVAIWLTHGHFDHVYGVKSVSCKYGISVMMDPADKVILENNGMIASRFGMPEPDCTFPTTDIAEGDVLKFGNASFTVISTPGHTPGGVCFHCEEDKILISGDTLFAGSIGRTDYEWGDYDKLIVGIMEKLMGLDAETVVVPGHGDTTTIGRERTHNPFLEPFNEPWENESPDEDIEGIELHGLN